MLINDYQYLLIAVKAALEASTKILEIYNRDFEISQKADNSPVTLADKAANDIIVCILKKTGLPILSEESVIPEYQQRKSWKMFWMVDPLDGTKEFIQRNGEFTVNIALIKEGVPIMGVVYSPVLNQLYIGASDIGAYKLQVKTFDEFSIDLLKAHCRLPLISTKKLTVVCSKSHKSSETNEYIQKITCNSSKFEIISMGSSLKFCLVAEGVADIYPRLSPTMEWDSAAAHAVCTAAGKRVYHYESNKELTYNKENLLNPWFVVQ